MNPTSERTYRRFLVVGREVLRRCVPALLAVTVLTVVASVPAAARAGDRSCPLRHRVLPQRRLLSPSMMA